jgi:hypothetical protein
MLSSDGYPPTSLENLRVNTLWDGLFHGFTWIITALFEESSPPSMAMGAPLNT